MIQKIVLLIMFSVISLASQADVWDQPGRWGEISLDGGFSRVIIYRPDTQSPIGDGQALMIVLHGCMQDISVFAEAGLEEAADTYGMVIAVPEVEYPAGLDCYAYWEGSPARDFRDYANILNLVDSITGLINIDPDQVYLAGLSSGGSFAMEVGCLAPDIFAGIGVSGAPSAGTSANGSFGPVEGTIDSTAQACFSYAGAFESYFDSQIFNAAAGTDGDGLFIDSDSLVPREYTPQNAGAMAQIYGVEPLSGTNEIEMDGRIAIETRWENGRVTMLAMPGVPHAWSGGPFAIDQGWISNRNINYATYLAEFFTNNNKRVGASEKPLISVEMSSEDTTMTISGWVRDFDGYINSATYSLTNGSIPENELTGSLVLDDNGNFQMKYNHLLDGEYQMLITATDNDGGESIKVETTMIETSLVTYDQDADNDVDRDDLLVLRQYLNQSADSQFDRRDINSDGTISATDMRGLARECSLSRCAILYAACPHITGLITDDMVDNGLVTLYAPWFSPEMYRTTGDDVIVQGDMEYTIYIGNDQKGYMEDPKNCTE